MNLHEEKKEATGWKEGENWRTSDDTGKEEDDDESDDDDESEELEDLPTSVIERIGTSFKSEEELEAALVKAGVGDLPVILVDGKPRLITPSDQHNDFTSNYLLNFINFANNRWGTARATHKIHLLGGRSRDPDLSYWGYPRCYKNEEGSLKPIDSGIGAVPDAIIQFSWKNREEYEESAINDIMNRALNRNHGVLSTTCPKVGFLIKVRFSRKRTLQGAVNGSKTQDVEGLDIYRLTHGTTMADARDPNNPNATHWRYDPSGPECFITITPGDLGITGVWAFLCGDYKIKASCLFQKVRKVQLERQKYGLAT